MGITSKAYIKFSPVRIAVVTMMAIARKLKINAFMFNIWEGETSHIVFSSMILIVLLNIASVN